MSNTVETVSREEISFEEAQPFIREEISRWFVERGHDLAENSVELSIQTNTSKVPKRAEIVLKVLQEYTPAKVLENKRILDIGCGYGALSIHMYQETNPAKYVAIDPDPSFLQVAHNTANHMNLKNIQFRQGDMTDLSEISEEFDVIILNNSFIYLPGTEKIEAAVRNFYRLLKPGGTVIIYSPNRWYYREAFTKLVGVQFMPYWLANWYVRKKGKMNGYDHLRLLSPWELYRFFKKAGFSDCDTVTTYKNRGRKGLKRFFRPYIFFTATK